MIVRDCRSRTVRPDEYQTQSATPSYSDDDHSSHDAKLQVELLKSEVDSLRRQLAERNSHIVTTDDLQLGLEKQLSSHVAEISVSCCIMTMLVLWLLWFSVSLVLLHIED